MANTVCVTDPRTKQKQCVEICKAEVAMKCISDPMGAGLCSDQPTGRFECDLTPLITLFRQLLDGRANSISK